MPNPSRPALAVVVPATDRPPTLSRCLAALAASSVPAEEVVVVDEPAGMGPAAARNRGAGDTSAELIAFVDADVEVHADALERIRDAFAGQASPAAVFGAYDDAPAAPGLVSRFRNLLHHHVHVTSAGEADTFWSGLGAVRREPLIAAGGFDAHRFTVASVEDIDLGMRLRDRGATIVLDPSIRGTHLKPWSLAGMIRTDFARRAVPWARLLLERRGQKATLNLKAAHRLSALCALAIVGAAAARRPRTGAVALAILGALNARFYALLARRGGTRLLVAGIGLHIVHHLVAAAAVPVAIALHLRGARA